MLFCTILLLLSCSSESVTEAFMGTGLVGTHEIVHKPLTFIEIDPANIAFSKVDGFKQPASSGIQSATLIDNTIYVFRADASCLLIDNDDFSKNEAVDLQVNSIYAHANCVQHYASATDTLFYMAGLLRKPNLYVYRKEGTGIKFVSEVNFANDYNPQGIAVEGKNLRMYTLAYDKNSSTDTTENCLHLSRYAVADTICSLAQQDTTIYDLPFLPAIQDCMIENDLVMACYGLTSTDKGIIAFAPKRERLYHLLLNRFTAEEPEGLYVKDSSIYIMTQSGNLYKIDQLFNEISNSSNE